MILSEKEFKHLARKSNLIALVDEIPADLETPISCFLKLASSSKACFLLESAEQNEQIGRYTIIGFDPLIEITGFERSVEVKNSLTSTKRKFSAEILSVIQQTLESLKLANPSAIAGFPGGFVGYLAYENVSQFEDIQLKPKKSSSIPKSVFLLSRSYVVFDHYKKHLQLVRLVPVSQKISLAKRYREGIAVLRQMKRGLAKPLSGKEKKKPSKSSFSLRSNMTPRRFYENVNRIKSYIRAGDCIQVVLSQRFTISGKHDDMRIYRALRAINPSPYMFYFKYHGLRLIGASPEMLVKKEGRVAEVRPIAGTRPRGRNPKEDKTYEESLKRSTKETAEHLMLVDLGRNDLGRVCEFESVRVSHFARVERYSHVMHLVSDVEGVLKKNMTAFDLLRATFPAGTVSGAPKIRAMQIIDELEPTVRGPYAGSVGYFGLNGDMDMCIAIRTLILNQKELYLQAGAGIVKDSNPVREYQETMNKAKAILRSIEMQNQFV